MLVGIVLSEPLCVKDCSSPFFTPIEILPEWYFLAAFNFLRVFQIKLLGILSMAYLALVLLVSLFLENVSRFQNAFRRPLTLHVLVSFISYSL